MLNPFPELLTFGLLAPFILRVALGILFIDLGKLALQGEKESWKMFFEFLRLRPSTFFVTILGWTEIIGGIMLIAGYSTQIVALVFSALLFIEFVIEYKEESLLKRDIVFYLLMLVISVSLLFSGAGFFAFDLPL
ncbi:MAG: DoxX family protein [Candidatus Pacebacteria bacterium]|nr:DoxX family protein [Candidatus Paceibacterota bacterium]